jgi:hypothetical protein
LPLVLIMRTSLFHIEHIDGRGMAIFVKNDVHGFNFAMAENARGHAIAVECSANADDN